MDVLKIITDAVENHRNRPSSQPNCRCTLHFLFPENVWGWLHDQNEWRKVRAWVLSGQLSDEAIMHLKEHHTAFWRWHEERNDV